MQQAKVQRRNCNKSLQKQRIRWLRRANSGPKSLQTGCNGLDLVHVLSPYGQGHVSTRSQLTWNEKQKRWFKKYRGKLYCVSAKQLAELKDCPATMHGSRAAANAWWKAKRQEIDVASLVVRLAAIDAWHFARERAVRR